MSEMMWGLLGPEKMARTRRIRSLGLVASVRAFNDLAVPGMGGVWFGKQFMLATLGVALAQKSRLAGRRVQNIEMANAVEALGCCFALDARGEGRDARVRGSTKLRGKTDRSFAIVRKPGFYVSQPMRMATVQGLPALGLVEAGGNRFNAFACTPTAHDLLDASVTARSGFNDLMKWIEGDADVTAEALRKALSPAAQLPPAAREILSERLAQGHESETCSNRNRRIAVLNWVEEVRKSGIGLKDWSQRPTQLVDEHWFDLRGGSLLFAMRDAALTALDMVEGHINTLHAPRLNLMDHLPDPIQKQLVVLRARALEFKEHGHDDLEAQKFVSDCGKGDADLLASMVSRDGRVLRLVAGQILPGPAFQKSAMIEAVHEETTSVDPAAEVEEPDYITWPSDISGRIHNLFLFNADMKGELDRWVGTKAEDSVEGAAA